MNQKGKTFILVLLSISISSSSETDKGIYFKKLEFHKFEGDVIEIVSVTDILFCCLKCKRLPNCLSINYAHTTEIYGIHQCELLRNYKASENSGLLYPSRSYHHFTRVVDNCAKCKNGGTCKDFGDYFHCFCPKGFMGKQCEAKDSWYWLKINTNPVCFGTKNSSFGRFAIKKNGAIQAVKLVHISGLMSCNNINSVVRKSYWGCGDEALMTVITNDQNKKILPQDDYIIDILWLQYSIPGINATSPELLFQNFTVPMEVTAGQEYRIWYGQDLKDTSEDNNEGNACVDVYMYGWFR